LNNTQVFKIYDLNIKEFYKIDKSMIDCIKQSSPSVAIHVRAGDYISSVLDVVGSAYFENAIKYIVQALFPCHPTFFVFSNDMSYARSVLVGIGNYRTYFMDHYDSDNGINDMRLMYQCDHHIISNSSFSWWPAYLKTEKGHVTIMPSRWFT